MGEETKNFDGVLSSCEYKQGAKESAFSMQSTWRKREIEHTPPIIFSKGIVLGPVYE
jgi:hypothetical protein